MESENMLIAGKRYNLCVSAYQKQTPGLFRAFVFVMDRYILMWIFQKVRNGWSGFIEVYRHASEDERQHRGSLMHARPLLTGLKGYQRPSKYDYKELTNILALMLSAGEKSLQSIDYQKDLVLVTKQILDNLIIPLRKKINEAYVNRDMVELEKQIAVFLEIMDDQDRLLATQSDLLLGKWLSDARKFGNDSISKAYYEKNARVLITTWGNEGNGIIDYASRGLSGLISSYYKVRWEKFFDILRTSIANNSDLDMDAVNKEMASFEWGWTNQQETFNAEPQGNPLAIVKEIHQKYNRLFEICNY